MVIDVTPFHWGGHGDTDENPQQHEKHEYHEQHHVCAIGRQDTQMQPARRDPVVHKQLISANKQTNKEPVLIRGDGPIRIGALVLKMDRSAFYQAMDHLHQ